MNGEWVKQHKPNFGPGTRERYQQASKTTQEQVHHKTTMPAVAACMTGKCANS